LKRCLHNFKTPTRQKSCRQCTSAKSRCDLQRPHCGRCQTRSLDCEFNLEDGSAIPLQCGVKNSPVNHLKPRDQSEPLGDNISTTTLTPLCESSTLATAASSYITTPESDFQTAARHWDDVPDGIAPELVSSRQRSQIILGTPHGTPSTDTLARHTMFLVIRVLRSWPRMMAATHMSRFPPIIHHVQLVQGIPLVLAYCYTLVKMWFARESDNRESVNGLMIKEVKRLLHEVCFIFGCSQSTLTFFPASILRRIGSSCCNAVSSDSCNHPFLR
jgi:hypothetical protein